MRFIQFLTSLFFAAIPFVASAESATQLLLEFGTPRAKLWAILEEKPPGGEQLAFSLADQLALNPERKYWPFLAGTTISFTPLLRYDRNVNSGFLQDKIYIMGVPFQVDEEARAVEAAVFGGAIASVVSLGVARGTTLTFSGRGSYQRTFERELEILANSAAVTLSYTAQNWLYLDASFLLNDERRALATNNRKLISLTTGKLFGKRGRIQDISGTIIYAKEDLTWQSRIRVDWTGAFSETGMFKIGLEGTRKIDGEPTPQVTITGSYSNVLLGGRTTFSTTFKKENRGKLFGVYRNDSIYNIGVTRDISDRVSVYINYDITKSNIRGFDATGLDFGFNIIGFKF